MRFLHLLLLLACMRSATAASVALADAQLVYVAGSNEVALDGAAVLSGADFTSGSPLSVEMELRSGGVTGEDLLQVRPSGDVTLAAGVVSVAGTPVGSYSAPGTAASPLVISIIAGSTATQVEALIRALAYNNLAGNSATGVRTIRVTVTDRTSTFFDERQVNVQPGNAVPALTIGGALLVPRTARVVVGNSLLSAIDEDPAHDLEYELGSLPQRGYLILTVVDTSSGGTSGNVLRTDILGGGVTTFTQADIDSGRLRYEHLGGPETSDGFTVRVRDTADAVTPLAAVAITITGIVADPVITLPAGMLSYGEQDPAPPLAMDAAAPDVLSVAVNDGDSLHFRRAVLVARIVDAQGNDAGVTGDTIDLRSANGPAPSAPAVQTGHISTSGSTIYIRQSASGLALPATAGGAAAPDQVLGTRDGTDNGQNGRALRITLASTVIENTTAQPWPAGSTLDSEVEVVTPTAVAQLIANLTLAHPGDNPPTTPRFLQVTLTEASPNTGSGSVSRALTVVPVNDPPVFVPAGPTTLSAIAGRPLIASVRASDPDLPAGASLSYRLASPVAGVALDAASGMLTWVPPDDTPVNLQVIAQDDQGADSAALSLTIDPETGVTADPPYIVTDPLVEIGAGELIFHPFSLVPPAGSTLPITVQVVGDAPPGAAVDFASVDRLAWTLTAPAVPRPANGLYTFGLRVTVSTGGGPQVGYQPITLVVLDVSGSN